MVKKHSSKQMEVQKINLKFENKRHQGTINIARGVKLGLKMIKKRKYKNPITCMFVFSNGQDNSQGVDQRIAQSIQEYQIEQQFIINTYGYGLNHNAKLLSDIAELKQGTFTYVENIRQVPQCFMSSMDGKLPVLAKDVKISIIENQDYHITKIIGDGYLWKQEQPGIFSLKLNYILKKEQKDYLLFLEIPSCEKINSIKDVVLKAQVEGMIADTNTKFITQAELKLNFTLKEYQFESKKLFEEKYLMVQTGDAIRQAKEYAIEASKFKRFKSLKDLLQNLSDIKQVCQPQLFEEKGQALMLKRYCQYVEQQLSPNDSISDQEECIYLFIQRKDSCENSDIHANKCLGHYENSFSSDQS